MLWAILAMGKREIGCTRHGILHGKIWDPGEAKQKWENRRTEKYGIFWQMGMGQNPIPLVNIKIAGKWMFIPLKMVCIGIDP